MQKRPTIFALTLLSAVVASVVFLRATPGSSVMMAATTSASAAAPSKTGTANQQLDDSFRATVKPLVQTYCVTCHSGATPKGDFDLSAFTSLASVTKDFSHWSLVEERLKAGEMPPEEAKSHPTPDQRQQIIAWIESVKAEAARRDAGDPGPVLARRLSNAEYDYTVRDLTGVDIHPTKEFPMDPANQAGFDNSGESLSMSPELVKKYMDAAEQVADHIVFTPEGFHFAPYPVITDEDRDRYAVERIVNFYKAQGLTVTTTFDTFNDELVDYADYFVAAWRYQNRAALGTPNATLADIAHTANLSPKYLNTIYTTLSGKAQDVGPIAALQVRWRGLPAPVDGKAPDAVSQQCGWMRDFITNLRPYVTKVYANYPVPRGARGSDSILPGSQTLMLWKDKQYATSRLTYWGNAQTIDMTPYAQSDPAMTIPTTDDGKARLEDSFKQFCGTFPDGFVVWERARMYDTSQNDIRSDLSGHRLLSAGFHSQMGFFRDDAPLYSLMLDDQQQKQLDELWKDLDFITNAPERQHRQFLWYERGESNFMLSSEFFGFRPEDADATSEKRIMELSVLYNAKAKALGYDDALQQVIQDYFTGINASIRSLEKARVDAEPIQISAMLDFAQRAYRRPLTQAEKDDIVAYYHSLRTNDKLDHPDAIRETVASVLMSPYFSYLVEMPDNGKSHSLSADSSVAVQPLSDYELASRLSYFLWSSTPDQELLDHAKAGDLHRPEVLVAQARRMMQDSRIQDFATEFGGNWLDFRHFEQHNAVDRDHFPNFTDDLREAMYQEPVHFFVNMIQKDRSVLDLVYGDYTFVNPILAALYGMPVPADTAPDQWVEVDDAQKYQRGGLLPMSVFLTQNSPGLRTSPVKRGYWVVTRLLGQTIPPPPPNVPAIPSDESKLGGLTLAETLARHHADPVCASCHAKFDAFGLVFEGFGPIGEGRTLDLGNHPVQISATFPDGTKENGVDGLRDYLHTKVQNEFLDNLSRKLLSYALGRTLLLSDNPLLTAMNQNLTANGDRFSALVESVVTSPQFLTKRSSTDAPDASDPHNLSDSKNAADPHKLPAS